MDALILKMADYICDYKITSALAFETAKTSFVDSLGCAILALSFPACTKLLGPWVPGITVEKGASVIAQKESLDPIKAAFDFGTMIRWLDYNDTWLAQEWGHPSDNLGGILSVMDFVSKRPKGYQHRIYCIQDVLDAMIRAYEIQGILALENSFNAVGLDHVVLVKVATTGVVTKLLGGTKTQVMDALSQAWLDGQSLRTYRHAPNTGSRKSWAAGDATSRGVRLALLTLQGEKGYQSALSAPQWGFNEVMMRENPIKISQDFGSYVMENILFKVAYPAEFHAQTAVECALKLHDKIKPHFEGIQKIVITTHSAAMRIINKKGPLQNPADRDHCMQYMVAVALLKGELMAEFYEDDFAKSHPDIDLLRDKIVMGENPQYSKDYLEPTKRAITSTLEIYLENGTLLRETCEYPLGHRQRRAEALPLLWEKLENNLLSFYDASKVAHLLALLKNDGKLLLMTVPAFIELWKKN